MPTTTTDCAGCIAILDRWYRKSEIDGTDPNFPPHTLLAVACRDCGAKPLLALFVASSLIDLTGEDT